MKNKYKINSMNKSKSLKPKESWKPSRNLIVFIKNEVINKKTQWLSEEDSCNLLKISKDILKKSIKSNNIELKFVKEEVYYKKEQILNLRNKLNSNN